jgi:hypothetical protein
MKKIENAQNQILEYPSSGPSSEKKCNKKKFQRSASSVPSKKEKLVKNKIK